MSSRAARRRGPLVACLVLGLAACRPALRDPATLQPASDGAADDGAPRADGPRRDGPRTDAPRSDRAQTPSDASCPPLVLEAVADAYVDQDTPTRNYGTASVIEVDSGQHGYLRFAISGLTGAVTSAALRLHLSNDTVDGPKIFTTANTWDETALTWANRPGPDGSALRDASALGFGWQQIDLGAPAIAEGELSFVLIPTSENGLTFSSREGANAPQLLLGSGCKLSAGDGA